LNTSHAARRLRPFLAGSIVLHLAVLASAAAMRLDIFGTPTISVELETDTAPVGAVPARAALGTAVRATVGAASAANNSVDRVSRLKPLLREPPDVADAVEQVSRGIAETSAQSPGTHATQAAAEDTNAEPVEDSSTRTTAATQTAAATELRGRIESELARYFQYPPLARREGWEGVVQLQFDVAGDGAIRNIQLASSSGYALLDRAAQDALAKAARVTVPPALAGGARAIALPVRYRLTEAR
jgi:TonB family protein